MNGNPRKKGPPAPLGPALQDPPTPEEIAERAYEIYLARGEAPGHDQEDWLRAERELIAERERGEAPKV